MKLVSLVAAAAAAAAAAAGVAVPTAAQLAWQNQQGAIIHYNMATFIGHQGCDRSNWVASNNPLSFAPPANVDTDSWGRAMVAANITYAV